VLDAFAHINLIGEREMPIHFWTLQKAILITKKARVLIPTVIAAGGVVVGAVGGFIAGWFTRKKTKSKSSKAISKSKILD
jgi:hypothetical protein